ncbi:MAG: DUF5667 domain-containing protein [Candidatus Nealsonbacteria bacterium]
MKTKFLVLFIGLSLLVSFNFAQAQEVELPNPGLTPDSPFYFLETIIEEIGTFFTFGDLKKAERHTILAAERLAEAQAVVEKGKPELAEKTLKRYEMQLQNSIARAEKAQAKGENTEKVMARVGQATSKHLEVLVEVYEKVPEQAKPAIENAMKASLKGHERAVETLKAQNALGDVPEEATLPAQIPQEVRERIQTRVQQELEIEKALEGIDTSKSLRDICAEQGGTPEMCEQWPLEKFKSFEQIETWCIERGLSPEICASALTEAKCREFGMTTANECFIFLSVSSIKAYQSVELKFVPKSSLSEEEMEQRREQEEEGRTIRYQAGEEIIEIPMEELKCEFNEMIFYYSDTCSSCQKVKDDGTIEKIEELGIKVNQANIAFEPIKYQLQGVPSFVINEKVYLGYKTFKELIELLECK